MAAPVAAPVAVPKQDLFEMFESPSATPSAPQAIATGGSSIQQTTNHYHQQTAQAPPTDLFSQMNINPTAAPTQAAPVQQPGFGLPTAQPVAQPQPDLFSGTTFNQPPAQAPTATAGPPSGLGLFETTPVSPPQNSVDAASVTTQPSFTS